MSKAKQDITPSKVPMWLTESYLTGVNACKANLISRRTIGIDNLIQRIVNSRSYFRKESLIASFGLYAPLGGTYSKMIRKGLRYLYGR